MTIESMYGTLSTLLRAYDAEAGRHKAEAVIADPAGGLDSENPVYSAAAALLTDLRAKLDARTTPKAVAAAVRRVIRNCSPARPEMCGMFPYDGRFVVCDGYRLLRLNADITSLPHVVNDFDAASAMRGAATSGEALSLPTAAELKAFLTAEKARKKQEGRAFRRAPFCLDGWMYVDPQYLLDMMGALPGCTAYRPKRQTDFIYFQAENGDGILGPINPAKVAKKTA